MNGNPVDQLSDDAMGARKAARATHGEQAQKDASQKHQAAYVAAMAGGRPSLAAHHLREAADHDEHGDPTSLKGKAAAAHRASSKAHASDSAKDHEDAAKAHDVARNEALDKNSGRDAAKHGVLASEHRQKADAIKNPPPPGARSTMGPMPMGPFG